MVDTILGNIGEPLKVDEENDETTDEDHEEESMNRGRAFRLDLEDRISLGEERQ